MVLFDRIKIWKCRVYDKEEKQVNPGKTSRCKAENLIKHSTQEGRRLQIGRKGLLFILFAEI